MIAAASTIANKLIPDDSISAKREKGLDSKEFQEEFVLEIGEEISGQEREREREFPQEQPTNQPIIWVTVI